MTTKEVKRRISDALLKGGLEKDAGLDALIAGDTEAKAYADYLARLDGLLTKWPLPDRGDEGWEALATRIEQRVKDRVTAPGDLTLPPRFDDDDPFVREPSTFSPARPGGTATAARPAVIPKPGAVATVAKPTQPVAAAKPAAAKPMLGPRLADARPIEAAKPAEVAKAAEVAKPTEAKPIEVAKAADVKPTEVAKPVELAKPAEPKSIEVAKATEVAKPVEATSAEAEAAATFAEPPAEAPFEERRITTEIAIGDLETVSVPPVPPTRKAQTTEEIAIGDLQKVSTPPVATPAAAAPDFSLANLGALEVKHAAPPPVPKTPPKAAHHRAPEPKDDRATIPPVRQPLSPLGPLPDFAAAPLAVAPLKKSRAPLYGSLAAAATVVVAVGGWYALQATGSNAPAAAVVAQQDEQAEPALRAEAAQGGAAPPAVALPVPGAAPATPVVAADRGVDPGVANAELAVTGATTPTPTAPLAVTATADGTLMHEEGDAVTRAGEGGGPAPAHAHGGGARPAHDAAGAAAPPMGGTGGAADTHAAHTPTTAHVATEATGATTHHGHASADAPRPSGDNPGREDVVRAMGTVHAAVQTCAAGRGGVAWVQVTFSGGTGRVSNALVQGQFAGTPQGSCIARAVRGAQVQPFTNATFSVAYPFQL